MGTAEGLPAGEKGELLTTLVRALAEVPHMAAVVLGGSYAEGTQTAASDLDIGLYYRAAAPFALEDVRAVAAQAAVQRPTVTGFYEWGPWVNGGAWIQTAAGKVDFLYRNLDQVEATIGEAETGVWRHDYSQQPTFGFYSVMYLAETQICRPLWDPQGVLEGLKARVAVYPPALKARVVADGLWSTEFTLRHAEVYAARGDVYNTAGCLARCATNLTQALFGLNEVYFLSDKRALRQIEGFAQKPQGYGARLCAVLACPGRSAEELTASVGEVKTLWGEACGLAVEIYRGSEW